MNAGPSRVGTVVGVPGTPELTGYTEMHPGPVSTCAVQSLVNGQQSAGRVNGHAGGSETGWLHGSVCQRQPTGADGGAVGKHLTGTTRSVVIQCVREVPAGVGKDVSW